MTIEDRNYHSDYRVRAGHRQRDSLIRSCDTKTMQATVVLEGDDGEEEEHLAPIRFEVCPTCRGKGSHVNPSVDAGGLTGDDFAEDPDFAEAYVDGMYDVTCYECSGDRVVPVLDRDSIDPGLLRRIDQHEKDTAAYRSECEAERRMGC